MIDSTSVIAFAALVIVGGVGARLLVEYPDAIADRLGVRTASLGALVVGGHLAANLILGAAVLGRVILGPSLPGSPLASLAMIAVPVAIVTSILSVGAISLDRRVRPAPNVWTPTRWYYLMAIPLLVNAILYGCDYFYQRRTHAA